MSPLLPQRSLDLSKFSRLNKRTCSRLSDVIIVPDSPNDHPATVLVVAIDLPASQEFSVRQRCTRLKPTGQLFGFSCGALWVWYFCSYSHHSCLNGVIVPIKQIDKASNAEVLRKTNASHTKRSLFCQDYCDEQPALASKNNPSILLHVTRANVVAFWKIPKQKMTVSAVKLP
ncbi:hypothetical protein T265_11772 [Opisthorchis viverrini]|uniref:Uncharacterized protein n=1 Tax=Opisthorchis viverrini TaxID=6198 RepID=A0A074Z1U0_OPIVI|nr:hypothetical protein T265_11772 [Opisthorchis viverrini]KER19462.1 hypothetical protein T265_11772 [Opisthorchis viverrini]